MDNSFGSFNKTALPIPVVRFLDLSVKDEDERRSIMDAIATVLDHGQLVLGPEVETLEERVAEFCGRRFAVGVNSGTDSLILGLKALGIGQGDEVITTPLSWLATGSAILLNGATAVFGDIDNTLTLDPTTIEPLITSRTKAILPVHFTGQMARMPEIAEIAKRHDLLVIEDGAPAFGATLDGRMCGGFGDIACLSFNAMKPLGALGDAGIILTDDAKVAQHLKILRHSGAVDRHYCQELSYNCRIDTLQAAVLLTRLERYPSVVARRREIAEHYSRKLSGFVETPFRPDGYENVFYTYTIRTPYRDELCDHLTHHNIETRIHHPVLMNDQPAFQGQIRGDSPKATMLTKQILSIPFHEKLTLAEQNLVISAIVDFFEGLS